jgi:hypothetical protein
MLFDLEPYIPLQVFAPMVIILACAFVAWRADRNRSK